METLLVVVPLVELEAALTAAREAKVTRTVENCIVVVVVIIVVDVLV